MNELELAREKLAEIKKEETNLICEMKETYSVEDADYEDYGFSNTYHDFIQYIAEESILIDYDDQRDLEYLDDELCSQELLIRALEIFDAGDKKSLHNARKSFEELVRRARRIKKQRRDDIEKAEKTIRAMDELIAVCDKFRK